jgi:glutathione S-transferase
MSGKRLFIHTLFLFLLPLIVAWFGISVGGAIALVIFALLWRWLISISGILAPANIPDIELETIAASHFVEKVRWCMDRLGIEYTERQWAGVLGVFLLGRSVPELKIRTGLVRSKIGNSPEILRYLWGAYAATLGDRASFLEPTGERLEYELRLDRYGRNLQVWVYYHILEDRALTLHAWGCNSPSIPAWQRYLVIGLFPVLRSFLRKAFRISETAYAKSMQHIDSILAEADLALADGRVSILGGESINYTDITFAAFSALWLQPPQYGLEKADNVRVERQRVPAAMRADIERWIEAYPRATAFITRLYETERTG